MTIDLSAFPLTGFSVSQVLKEVACPDQFWNLTEIETLAKSPAVALGDLWRRVRVGPITVSTLDLCEALEQAYQVVSLDLSLTSNPHIHLVVEDGLAVVRDLS